jgi:hypothetical protein
MSGPVAAILLTVVVHVVAFVLLFAMMGRDFVDVFRSGGGGGDGGSRPGPQPVVEPDPSGGGLPLPDADPAPVRLREPGRIAERYPRRPRRPEHAPEPAPLPERV